MAVATSGLDGSVRQEFQDGAEDRLGELDWLLGQASQAGFADAPQIAALRQIAHNLKGLGAAFGAIALAALAHRLEDYLSGLERLAGDDLAAVQLIADRFQDAVEAAVSGRDDPVALLAGLPRRAADAPGARRVLLVMPRARARQIVGHLQSAGGGLAIDIVPSALEAIRTASRTRPGLIILAAVLPELGGIDLACALAAMPATGAIPLALLTSLGRGDPALGELPERVALLCPGPAFEDALDRLLADAGLV
jgi:CheY-like chemotaxis protein